MPQKTARKKLLMMRNGTPPDVGPPLRRGAYGVRSPRPENGHLLAPRVDQLAHLSGTERQGCSWGASRDSGGRAAAQPPCACTRTQKVPWRPCSCVQLAAPRCPRRPPAWPCHQSRRQNTQQRKTSTYTALPVATRWPPCRRRHPWRHLFRRRARPCCRHIKRNMILTQPGAWSAEPSGLRSAPCSSISSLPPTRHAAGARESQEVREGCDGWRRPHPEQPFGGPDGCRTRQHGGSGLKSTTGASGGAS